MLNEDGFFYLEHRRIEELTLISEYRQKIAMKKLEEINILEISKKKKGIPPKKFYRVDCELYKKIALKLNQKKLK